jgi:AcrR family transcriptional regulator
MTRIVGEEGIENASVTRVLAQGAIARAAFYQVFHDRDDCLQAAVESAVQRSRAHVLGADRAERPWRTQIRGGLQALLEHFEEEPDSARLCIGYVTRPSPAPVPLRRQILHELAGVIDRGRDGEDDLPAPLTAEGIVAGVLGILERRLGEARRPPLSELTGPLMSFIVLPYRGARAAREELALASTKPARRSGRSNAQPPVKSIRITYRTMRVLAAIGESPGLSNAEVAELADVTDQGQISKLLKRLRDLELIENTSGGQSRGEANAWRLTRAGRRQSAMLDHGLGRA